MEDTRVHALDYLKVFQRRKWWLFAPVLAVDRRRRCCSCSSCRRSIGPTATLAVAAPACRRTSLTRPRTLDNQERLRALSQQLLSVPILAARRQGREASATAPTSGSSTQLRARRSTSACRIRWRTPTSRGARHVHRLVRRPAIRRTAQRVANRLVTVFVDENSKSRAASAEDTSVFIATQLQASQERLASSSRGCASPRKSHMGQLPEQTQANLPTLSGLRQQLEANATSLRGEQDRLSMIERQIEGMQQGSAGVDVRCRRAAMRQRRRHPKRGSLALRARAGGRPHALHRQAPGGAAPRGGARGGARRAPRPTGSGPAADRLATLQTRSGLPPARGGSGDGAAARPRSAARRKPTCAARSAMYQARVEAAPRVEQQLTAVQRDYDLEKQQYARPLRRSCTRRRSPSSVERSRRGEQFTVLYPAALPTEPTKPIPWRVMLMSILAGLCLGGGADASRANTSIDPFTTCAS